MAYGEELAARIDVQLGPRKNITTRKMFGGVCWMLGGNMMVGIVGDELMVRVGKEAGPELLKKPGARPMDFTGKPMAGYLYVGGKAIATEKGLTEWIGQAEAFVKTLPKK